MKPYLPLLILLCFGSLTSYCQQCGADILHRQRLKTDSLYAKATQLAKTELKEAVKIQKAASVLGAYYGMMATIYTIPVVVHVIHTGTAEGTGYNIPTATIQGAIDYLNSVYNGTMPGGEGVGDIGIQFALATRDPSNNPTTGIRRISLGHIPDYVSYGVRLQGANGLTDGQIKSLRWDESLYYNIYVVNRIDSKDGGPGAFVAGYAQFPGYNVHSDGTVMLASQMLTGRKTLPHEMGHALGLPHPFENADDPTSATCPVNVDCLVDGDGICDTDPITIPPFVARTGNNPCTGTPYNIYTEHNFMNYTDYTSLFTPDQRTTMLAVMTFPTRMSLASSWATAAAYPYTFSNPVASCVPVSNAIGTGGGYAGLLGVTVENRMFSSGLTATDPGYVNKATSPLHMVPLSQNASYTFSADVFALNEQQIAAYIDFNNDGAFDDATERIVYQDRIAGGGAQVARFTTSFPVPSYAVANTVLRMRVINELASIYGPYAPVINSGCYNPIYGQAEDFPVFIAGVLPASWKYFKGRKNGTEVLLQWSVATSVKNSRFDVERSVDGSSYLKIGTVQAAENVRLYNYPDQNALLPVYYYRLKQTDANGQSTYSSTIIIRNDQLTEDQSVRVTNPFSDRIDLSLEHSYLSPSTIDLMDLNGRRLLLKQLPASQKNMRINVGHLRLAPGVYMLKFRVGEVNVTKKIIKQ
ncbi:MAG: T9SS type A sorting domain-containing protein [Chitinophagaceae bacterium]|nr:MAG: T9SS type A sorting domain-containing protein [Chitinophagaceae bacterium]